jgi:DNA adenine methylase
MQESATPPRALRPPLKWYGGKFYLARWIISHFPTHRVYLEAFGGGASVLLNKPPAAVETYNDIDARITRFFRVLRDHGDAFSKRVRLVPYSQIEFADAANEARNATDIDHAVRDFIRWRQSFVGRGQTWSYTVGRSRGGKAEQVNGWWNAIDRLPEIIERLRRVQIICQSAFDAIARFDHPEGLIYCDPPYVHSTRDPHSRAVYHHEMTDDEHCKLAAVLRRCKAAVVISGYQSTLYDELYHDWRRVSREVPNRAAGARSKGRKTECLWMNY